MPEQHGMVPGSHERGNGPECRCGAAWDRWNDRCATAPVPPPADDQAARAEADPLTPEEAAYLSSEMALLGARTEINRLKAHVSTLEAERDVLSGLLRGMARRVGNLRKNGRHFTDITEKLQDRLDSACIERDDLQTELSDVDRLRRNHDALADAYIATREALDNERASSRDALANRDSSINRLLGQVAALRALHVDLRNSLFHVDGGIQWAHVESLVSRMAAVLDGPAEASPLVSPKQSQTPAMRYELSCFTCSRSPHFHLEPFESNDARQAWVDAHRAATGHEEYRFTNTPISSGPAEAAEPAPLALVAYCDNADDETGSPCQGWLRFRWGMTEAACDTCGGRCGIAVAQWARVEAAAAGAGAPEPANAPTCGHWARGEADDVVLLPESGCLACATWTPARAGGSSTTPAAPPRPRTAAQWKEIGHRARNLADACLHGNDDAMVLGGLLGMLIDAAGVSSTPDPLLLVADLDMAIRALGAAHEQPSSVDRLVAGQIMRRVRAALAGTATTTEETRDGG